MVTYHLCFSVCSVCFCLGYKRLRWTVLPVALGHDSSSQNLQCRHPGLQKPSHNPKPAQESEIEKIIVYRHKGPFIKKNKKNKIMRAGRGRSQSGRTAPCLCIWKWCCVQGPAGCFWGGLIWRAGTSPLTLETVQNWPRCWCPCCQTETWCRKRLFFYRLTRKCI